MRVNCELLVEANRTETGQGAGKRLLPGRDPFLEGAPLSSRVNSPSFHPDDPHRGCQKLL